MKRVMMLLFMLFITKASLIAQDKYNAVFYTEDGERFWLLINGIRQNEYAAPNVKVTDLKADQHKVKIIFEDYGQEEVKKTIYHPDESVELTYRIKMNKKGDYVVRYFAEAPLNTSTTTSTQHMVSILTTDVYPSNPREEVSTTTTTTTTTTSSTSSSSPDASGERVEGNLNINIGGGDGDFQFGVSVSGSDLDTYSEEAEVTISSSSSTTTTTTTTTSSSSSGSEYYILSENTESMGCARPMADNDFLQAKSSISSKSFDDSKLDIAKQVADANCLASTQIKQIMKLFSFEDSRLTFAKYAYNKTYDKGNYFQVNDAFDYELTIEELNDFIETQR